MGETQDYVTAIRLLASESKTVEAIYQSLTTQDIQLAADILYSAFESSDGHDGFVSMEVSPHLARDTRGTIKEARHWWDILNKPKTT
ncbi:MAG: transaldolase family protein [Desulfomonilaceae bacterium]